MTPLVLRGNRVPAEPEASIIILVLERVDLLLRCLESLARVEGPSYEILVVANGTPAGTIAALSARSDLVVVPVPVNLGFAGGCNWGARFARGRSIVLLNDDTEVEPGWLQALVDAAAHNERIGAVGSRLLDFGGRTLEAGGAVWRDGGVCRISRVQSDSDDANEVRDVDYCSACGLLVSRTAWEAVGGMDEAYYPAYHEDVDLAFSLRSCGYRTVYCPVARVHHHEGGSGGAPDLEFAAGQNGRYFSAKWAVELADYEPPPGECLDDALAAAAARTSARPLPALRALPKVAASDPTELDALQAQVRALLSSVRVKDAYMAELMSRVRERDAEIGNLRLQSEAIHRIVRRIPLGRRLARGVWGRMRRGNAG